MKIIKSLSLMLLAAGVAMALTGCQTQPHKTTLLPGGPGRTPIDPGLSPGTPIGGGDGPGAVTDPNGIHGANDPTRHKDYTDDAASLKSQTVYFDLDKSSIKSSEQSKLDEVANYLKSNADKALRVEGNCDERGTEEYNRSLGERRAIAAREYLINKGIDPQRVDTLTNGQDKPAAKGQGEEVWSKNRRDEFVVLVPPHP